MLIIISIVLLIGCAWAFAELNDEIVYRSGSGMDNHWLPRRRRSKHWGRW